MKMQSKQNIYLRTMNIIGSNQRQKDSSYEMLLKKSPHRNIKPNDFALKLVA